MSPLRGFFLCHALSSGLRHWLNYVAPVGAAIRLNPQGGPVPMHKCSPPCCHWIPPDLLAFLQKRPLFELLVRLPELLLRIHHDRSVPRHGFLKRLPRNQEEPNPLVPRLHGHLVAAVKEHECSVLGLFR